MSTTQSIPAVAPRGTRNVGSYVGATSTDRVIGSFVDVDQPTRTLRQQAVAFVRSLREPTPASGRVSGHGIVR